MIESTPRAWLAALLLLPACGDDASSGGTDSPAQTSSSSTTGTPDPTGTSTAPGSTGAPTTATTLPTGETTGSGSASGSDTADTSTGDPLTCPTHIRTERIASLVSLSFGWTGQGHNADPVDGMSTSYELVDCDDECRRCRFFGPVANAEDIPNDSRRCINDWPNQCESDADCGDGSTEGACQVLWLPPVQRTTSWTAAYAPALTEAQQTALETDSAFGAQGVVNLETGDLDFEVLNLRVSLGPGFSENCVNDTTPDDGVKDGVCADSGDPCDVATISANGSLSFDCSWTPNPINFPLPSHGLTSGGVQWEMSNSRPNCTFPGAEGLPCWCGVCSNDPTQPCLADSDCPGGSCGNAGDKEGPIVTLPNACAPGEACVWDPDSVSGTCANTMGGTSPCFPANGTWSVPGDTSVQEGFFTSTVAVLTCMPQVDPDRLIIVDPVNDISLDEAFGFPGPLLQQVPLKITPEFR
jgi:hypothetical protein